MSHRHFHGAQKNKFLANDDISIIQSPTNAPGRNTREEEEEEEEEEETVPGDESPRAATFSSGGPRPVLLTLSIMIFRLLPK